MKEIFMEPKKLLSLSLEIGYYMLKFGAEIYRVEQSIELICCAYGMKDVDVFAIPTSIVVTISDGPAFIQKRNGSKISDQFR
jgi:uncharacterized membrane protein YjjP (DUF1212 family)